MNRQQLIALAIAAANLLLMLLFPPFDYVGLKHGNIPTFDGFYFAFSSHANRVININFLTLEVIVVSVNAAIAWLLLRERPLGRRDPGGNRYQRSVLGLVAVNLVLIVLFPPFENYVAISQAALPTFEAFYFVFGDNSQRQLVMPILYLEFVAILANGALLWLLLKDRSQEQLSADEIRLLAEKVRGSHRDG
jgi:hypothetical protein